MSRSDGVLIFDSARAGALSGARSALPSDRTLLFQAGDLTIDCMVHAGAGNLRLVQGQVVTSETGKPVRAAGIRFVGEPSEVRTDEHGQFALSALVSEDDIVLRVEVDGAEHFCRIPVRGEA